MKNKQNGFSLVEIAIVLVIVGFMIGGLVTPLTVQIEQRKVSETQKALEDAREALAGFALRNGYLPCPAVSASNGLEDRAGTVCSEEKRQGFLPWATLGLPKLDSWSHILRYSVTPAFCDSGNRFSLKTLRDISVRGRDSAGQIVAATAPNDIPAVIMSHGKNGFGAVSDQGVPVAGGAAGNLDEIGNSDLAGTTFMARTIGSSAASPGGEFDDQVVWLSPNVLFNRMVAAQRLP